MYVVCFDLNYVIKVESYRGCVDEITRQIQDGNKFVLSEDLWNVMMQDSNDDVFTRFLARCKSMAENMAAFRIEKDGDGAIWLRVRAFYIGI
jgi:hypothetical protein